jgi:GxxExxY protein
MSICVHLCSSVAKLKETQEGGGEMTEEEINLLTERIIGCAFKVSNALGCGFLEKVYENALVHELRKNGLMAQPQHPINVHYEGVLVGEFYADILVSHTILVELKATTDHQDIYTAQCLNYLKGTGKPICLLLNFGKPRLEVKRYRR